MSKKKILVIEDEQDIATLLSIRLKNAGYEVVIADNGAQGVQRAHKEKPDLIILDLMLPAGNGLTVLENIRLSMYLRHIPVVILTGIKDEEYKKRALEKGVNGYVEKPYDPDILLDTIGNLLLGTKGDSSVGIS